MPVAARDRALVHGDLGLHNLALDPETDAVNGVFDYDGAAWADRHQVSWRRAWLHQPLSIIQQCPLASYMNTGILSGWELMPRSRSG